jgi:hypothetical protein
MSACPTSLFLNRFFQCHVDLFGIFVCVDCLFCCYFFNRLQIAVERVIKTLLIYQDDIWQGAFLFNLGRFQHAKDC